LKILILDSGDFTAPYVVGNLIQWGHTISVFHDSEIILDLPESVHQITGKCNALIDSKDALVDIDADVVIDMRAKTVSDANQLVEIFTKPDQRILLTSSVKAYRAYARHIKAEPGEPDLVPLLEDDPLCEDTHNTLVAIEKILINSDGISETILRLPFVYGPGDPARSFHEYLSKMDDNSEQISLSPLAGEWRAPSGYVEDIGYAIALATKNSKAAGKIYNIADSFAFTRVDWIRAIGRAAGWDGKVVTNSSDSEQLDYNQHLIMDSSKIRQDLGYIEQTPINDAFARTVEWERTQK
jgi:nucleoside-diphosphate-sugar epimerase